jgi:hypothetical protein
MNGDYDPSGRALAERIRAVEPVVDPEPQPVVDVQISFSLQGTIEDADVIVAEMVERLVLRHPVVQPVGFSIGERR